MRNQNNNSIFYNIDWITVLVYLVLMLMGWLNIYSAVYNEDHHVITDISQKYGKQMLWIATALVLALIILIIDENFYTVFAYFIFGTFLVANILVPFLGREVKGSRSWFRFGDFGIQPAEFMKFATNLALAKFLSNQNIKIADYKNTIISLLFLGVPLIIIAKLQDETGLAIVFAAFIFTLYREGLS
ncbi:MAG: rod shape-determining protein RodA, partial [Bacteroidia bacterium]